ncbi:MAG: two-component regulator propeller domain-containing protein [Bacteroidia bacterium]
MAVLEDGQGRLWVGTERNGLNIMDRENGTFWRFKDHEGYHESLTERSIYALFEDASGNIWVGSYGGLTKVYPQSVDAAFV